uniref:ATP-dependent RNA helicase DHX29 n=1 Tax=Denticeps clupeoides TaxID=299321 RepID=A0AAY4EE18_9TELE
MGGKKKKSPAATPAPAAAVSSAAEGAKQAPKGNHSKTAPKENKAKVPKTYCLTNTSQTDAGVATDKSVLKVVIQPDLEKTIIKLINDNAQEYCDKGPISGRITNKKLMDLYTALQRFHFKTMHIEEAMKSSMLYGGDLHSALDWLCLNLKDEELPEGFSQKMREENTSRPKFQPPKEQKTQDVAKKDSFKNTAQQTEKVQATTNHYNEMLCWHGKLIVNDRYLVLTAQLFDAKEMAAAAKSKKDKNGQRNAQDRIRVIQQGSSEMSRGLQQLPGSRDIFRSSYHDMIKGKGYIVVRKNEPKDIRNFDYTSRSWTGKSPKQFLIDWVRKNLPKSPPPTFQKVPAGRYWKCRVRVQRVDDVLEVCPTILTEDSMQAQHLGATLALYNLIKGQPVHQLLPPTYRDVWLEWRDSEQQQEEQRSTAVNKPRDQFIARLLARIKQQHQSQQSQPATVQPVPGNDEPEDSWESLASRQDEVEEMNQVVEKGDEAGSALLQRLRSSPLARKLLSERENLPVFQQRARLLEALRRHRVLVVAGETGSGKSTQVPQFILEDAMLEQGQRCSVVVTQPRRISAMSLASRVNQELGSEDGPGGRTSLCGYQIRMENRSGDSTRLLYCTTGVLLRKLQQDRLLRSLTHIIVDEVHERSVQSDFLLTILKDLVQKRSDLRLILMSATVDCDKFSSYFNRCPVIAIPGRTFPVDVFHLEDIVECTGYVLEQDSEYSQKSLEEEEEVSISVTQKGGKSLQHQVCVGRGGWDLGPELDHFSPRTRHALQYMNPNKINMDLIVDLLVYLDSAPQFLAVDGAMLVFLPGLAHIQKLYDLLSTDKRFSAKNRYRLVALHSTLSSQDQAAAFTVPPPGVRKIVLSTNIAETGVTIPDVVFVIDTGKTKENKYHESSQMSSLVETFVSKASALQRQGRAGRVREGFCFRLYTKNRFSGFMDYSIPEILRVPLEELCLHIMKCEYGSPEDFLGRALDAPQQQSVCNAVGHLRKIGACHPETHALTPLGHHLAALPVNVKIGKMLIFGAVLGCLDPIATIAAAISEKSPFATPMGRKEEANLAKSALAVANSDHLTIYSAYLGWRSARKEGNRAEVSYCRKHFLNRTALLTIEDVKQELIRMVEQAGFSPSKPKGSRSQTRTDAAGHLTSTGVSVLNAALTAGLYDSVGRIIYMPSVDVEERQACMVETPQGKAQVHPSSVNRNLQTYGWLLYQEKVKYSKVYLRDTSLISPFPMLLFGGDIEVHHCERLISLDGWIRFQAPVRIGVIFKHLRKLMDSLLEKKLENPRMNLEDEKTIQIITELIKSENTV